MIERHSENKIHKYSLQHIERIILMKKHEIEGLIQNLWRNIKFFKGSEK